jgi:hypothetical protein
VYSEGLVSPELVDGIDNQLLEGGADNPTLERPTEQSVGALPGQRVME